MGGIHLSAVHRLGIVSLGVAGALGMAVPSAGAANAARLSIGTSTQLAGYAAPVPASSSTALKMGIKVPVVSCPSSGTAAFNVIFNVFGTNGFMYGNITVSCSNGTAGYNASIGGSGTANGISWQDTRNFPVSAGNALQYSLSSTGSTTSSASLKDTTTGVHASFGGLAIAPSSVQIGDQPSGTGSGNASIPPFAKMSFTGLTCNGSAFSTLAPAGTNLVNSSNQVLIAVTALSPAGTSFSAIFKRSS
jgi:hypothetical protein